MISSEDRGIALDVLGQAHLKLDPESVSQARAHIREWLGVEHPAYDDVRLVVSELVTNAAVHARPRCDGDLIILALIRSADLFHVEVTDPGNPFSTPHVPDGMPYDTQSGRGLGIVCAISKRRWGVRDHGVLGRTVWCVIDARPTPGDSSAVPPCA